MAKADAPIRPAAPPPDVPRLAYHRGHRFPRAIAWFGARSFYGHAWHMAASMIATEDIDSRDWMAPDDADELTARAAKELGGDPHAPTLTDALEGDLWIDFIADTGDDASVSQAVAELVVSEFDVDDDGSELRLPRGHVLVFGGDTAYPVATEIEILNRVILPWGRALEGRDDGRRRVLLGVPGNHDWYAGLDGFGRMFRRRHGTLDRASVVLGADEASKARGASTKPLRELDPLAQIRHVARWVEAFRVGSYVRKRATLPLEGYTPVQRASYWALRLAPGLDFLAPDRQLRAVDFQQANFFAETRGAGHERGILLATADPAHAFLEPSAAGQEILAALELDLERDGIFVLTGDTHHYCRQRFGRGMHVIAGGGGAFLHPARILRSGLTPPEAEFPGPKASLALALQVPLQLANGRSGFLVHIAVALLYGPTLGAELTHETRSFGVAATTAAVSAIVCFLLGGGFRSPKTLWIAGLALVAGVAVGFLPYALETLLGPLVAMLGLDPTSLAGLALPLAIAVWAGTFVFGAYLMMLTILGLEQHQALSALAHPGYKHFVRLRVRRDGSRVDGWVIGKVDPLDPKDPVVLVDRFTWQNPRSRVEGE